MLSKLNLQFCLVRYDRDASRYHQGVYQRKRADLLGVIDSNLSPMFLGQLKNLHKSCLVTFKKDMTEGMRIEGYNFADVVSSSKSKCEKRFIEGASEAKLDDVDWTWEDDLEHLRDDMKAVSDQCRSDETKKMVNLIEVSVYYLLQETKADNTYSCRGLSRDRYLSPSNFNSVNPQRRCGIKF